MDEQKVRNAVKVTNELVPYSTTPESAYPRLWEAVFNSLLLYEPYPSNCTATGAELAQSVTTPPKSIKEPTT